MTTYHLDHRSPLGLLRITTDVQGTILTLKFVSDDPSDLPSLDAMKAKHISEQLTAYFEGRLQNFTLKLDLKGTEFQREVWDALQTIPSGTTTTYGTLAKQIGRPGAARAVGMANNKNPIAIIVPCHRVIGSNGKLVGYAGGLDIKRALLDLESQQTTLLSL